jgi:hypothetical protein
MTEKAILVLDDIHQSYPKDMDWFAENYGCRLVFADEDDPVGDGLRRIESDNDKTIVAVISDSFSGPPGVPDRPAKQFSHLATICARRPDLLIAIHCSVLSQAAKDRASEAGATRFYSKGDSLLPFYEEVKRLVARTSMSPLDRFWNDLPQLLETKFGKWVACTSDGVQHSGDDEHELYNRCRRDGLQPREFVVARVLPDQPEAVVLDEWLTDTAVP